MLISSISVNCAFAAASLSSGSPIARACTGSPDIHHRCSRWQKWIDDVGTLSSSLFPSCVNEISTVLYFPVGKWQQFFSECGDWFNVGYVKWFCTVVGIAAGTTDWKYANLSTGVDEEVESGDGVSDVEEVLLRFLPIVADISDDQQIRNLTDWSCKALGIW